MFQIYDIPHGLLTVKGLVREFSFAKEGFSKAQITLPDSFPWPMEIDGEWRVPEDRFIGLAIMVDELARMMRVDRPAFWNNQEERDTVYNDNFSLLKSALARTMPNLSPEKRFSSLGASCVIEIFSARDPRSSVRYYLAVYDAIDGDLFLRRDQSIVTKMQSLYGLTERVHHAWLETTSDMNTAPILEAMHVMRSQLAEIRETARNVSRFGMTISASKA